jgi:MFS family permease
MLINLLMAHLMQYSVFGSILTIGAMLGAVVSGSIADRAGRRGVSVNPIPALPNPDRTEPVSHQQTSPCAKAKQRDRVIVSFVYMFFSITS